MQFGRVHGSAVCTMKVEGIKGLKLLVVQPLDEQLRPKGALQVAVDVVQAGTGDLCVMGRSREAALAMPEETFVPVDLALIGIVDEMHVLPDGEYEVTLKKGHNAYT